MSNSLIKQFITSTVTVPDYTTRVWHPEVIETNPVLSVTLPKTIVISGGLQQLTFSRNQFGWFTQSSGNLFGSNNQNGASVTIPTRDRYGNLITFPAEIQGMLTITTPGYYTTTVVPGTTSQQSTPNLGWNASARSVGSLMGDGTASFSLGANDIGAVVGFNEMPDAESLGSGYVEITYGIYGSRGMARVIEGGNYKTGGVAYTDATVFSINRIAGAIYYLLDGRVIHKSASTSLEELLLDSSLYAGGDAVHNASWLTTATATVIEFRTAGLVATSTLMCQPKATAILTAVSTATFVGPYSIDDAVFSSSALTSVSGLTASANPPIATINMVAVATMVATGRNVTEMRGSLGNMTALATSGYATYAAIAASFAPMTAVAGADTISNNFIYIASAFESMTANVHSLVGATTTASTMYLPSMGALMTDKAYAEISGSLQPMSIFAAAMPPMNYSGCASIATVINGVVGHSSGTLLWGGRAILACCHGLTGTLVKDYSSIEIGFYSNAYVPKPEVIDVIYHPKYVPGNVYDDYDIAILILRDPVPGYIEQYGLYDGGRELEVPFTRLGYSPHVDPITGESGGLAWHPVRNQYEVYIDPDDAIAIANCPLPKATQLIFDYDNGTPEKDAIGGIFGIYNLGIPGEMGTRPGDSGSASFILDRIVGVTRSGFNKHLYSTIPGTYGTICTDVRALNYADWIYSNVPYDLFDIMTVEAELPMFGLDSMGHATDPLAVTVGFISSTLESFGGATATAGFALPSLSAAGTLTETMSLSMGLATFTFSSTMNVDERATAALGFTSWTATASGGGSAALSLPSFGLSANGTSAWNHIESTLSFLALSLSATGTYEESAQVTAGFISTSLSYCRITLTAPVFSFACVGSASLSSAIAYTMNVHTQESTAYSNYPFLHVIHIGGKPYGVKGDGLYLLQGDSDAGTLINGTVTTKETDFGFFASKRVEEIYLNSDTLTSVRPTVDGILAPTYSSSFKGRKVLLARGLEGRYWRFKIDKIIKLEGLEMTPELRQRGVK